MIVYKLKSNEFFCVSFFYRYAEIFFCFSKMLQNFCGEKLALAKNRLLITLKKLLQNIDFQLCSSVEKVVENFCEKMVFIKKICCNFAVSKMTEQKHKILTKKNKKMKTKKQKMTEKEFIAAFESAGFDFIICGYEGILNQISSLYHRYSKEAKSKFMRDFYSEKASKLHNLLEKRGYYNE